MLNSKSIFCLFIAAISTAVFFVYYPGAYGPFVFDDYGNILSNSFIRIKSLDPDALYYSSFSGSAGPLGRPVATLSFALNYYFSESIDSSFAFKITNIAIHALSASVLLIFISQLYRRSVLITNEQHRNTSIANPLYFALAISLIWSLHPINFTSVLYVVQRMTSLSGLFSLASLSLYMYARNDLLTRALNFRSIFGFIGSIACFVLALFSKENAILLPLFLLLIEATLYANTNPWGHLHSFTPNQKKIAWTMLLCCGIAFLAYCIQYALPGYDGRQFTLMERVLTETRVLCLYLSLILIPRINAFGLFHDDISISASLLTPPTTLLSIGLILGLLVIAYKTRQRHPLVTFGILWFFIGHLLESTIFALEIAHEHRNYLPSIGIILAVGALLTHFYHNSTRKLLLISCCVSLVAGGTTWMRASQWQDIHHLAHYEALHRPDSPATLGLLARSLYMKGNLQGSADATKRAAELAPGEAMHLLNLMLLSNEGVHIPEDTHDKILQILSNTGPSAATQMALDKITSCSEKVCKGLRKNLIEWLELIIQKYSDNPAAVSYYNYLKGRAHKGGGQYVEALNAFQKAYDGNNQFLHPIIEMVDILIRSNNIEQATLVFSWLEKANKTSSHPQNEAVDKLREVLEQLKAEKNHAPAVS